MYCIWSFQRKPDIQDWGCSMYMSPLCHIIPLIDVKPNNIGNPLTKYTCTNKQPSTNSERVYQYFPKSFIESGPLSQTLEKNWSMLREALHSGVKSRQRLQRPTEAAHGSLRIFKRWSSPQNCGLAVVRDCCVNLRDIIRGIHVSKTGSKNYGLIRVLFF